MINDKINLFNVISIKNNPLEYKCPSCGNVCTLEAQNCEMCDYKLKEYRNIILSKYNHYNAAIEFIKSKDYFNAIMAISRFLAFAPDDEKANEIYIYLLYMNKKYDDSETNYKFIHKLYWCININLK